jgi:flagellar L-ring protein precursor FlgH
MKRSLRLTIALLSLAVGAPTLLAQAAADQPAPVHHLTNWTADRHEYQVGDVITVLVTEATLATATKSQTGSDAQMRRNDLGLQPPSMGGASALPSMQATMNMDKNASSTQTGDAKRGVNFTGDISVRVVAVDPKTGLLQVKGAKVVDVDKNKQTLNLTGWVRPEDVSPQNFVTSERVADASLTYQLSGDIGKTRGGLIGRLLNVFWP